MDALLHVIPRAFCSPDHPTEMLLNDEFLCVVLGQSSHARHGMDF